MEAAGPAAAASGQQGEQPATLTAAPPPSAHEDGVLDWNALPGLVLEEVGSRFTGMDWLEKRGISKW